jgi:hypothetical protein
MSSFFLDQATAQRYNVGRPFVYQGRQYTSAGANPTKFAELGFIEVQIQPRPDDRFYINNGQCKDDGSWDSTPRDLDDLKVQWVQQQDQEEYSLLSPTDWMITRKAETGQDLEPEWSQYRSDVRTVGPVRRSQIEQVTTVPELEALVTNPAFVPVDPDDPSKGVKPNPEPHLQPWPDVPDLDPTTRR